MSLLCLDMFVNEGVVGLLVLSTVITILSSLLIGLGGRARVNAIRTPESAPKGRVYGKTNTLDNIYKLCFSKKER